MLEAVQLNLDKVSALCREHRVKRLALFGSAVTGDFQHSHSDLDIAVEFMPLSPTDHARAYFALLTSLEQLFSTKVDLVEVAAVRNPYLRREIEATAEALYAA